MNTSHCSKATPDFSESQGKATCLSLEPLLDQRRSMHSTMANLGTTTGTRALRRAWAWLGSPSSATPSCIAHSDLRGTPYSAPDIRSHIRARGFSTGLGRRILDTQVSSSQLR